MREALVKQIAGLCYGLFPWDMGEDLVELLGSNMVDGEWSDGRHIALASKVYDATRVMHGEVDCFIGGGSRE